MAMLTILLLYAFSLLVSFTVVTVIIYLINHYREPSIYYIDMTSDLSLFQRVDIESLKLCALYSIVINTSLVLLLALNRYDYLSFKGPIARFAKMGLKKDRCFDGVYKLHANQNINKNY